MGKDCADHVFTFILLYNFVSVDVFAYNYLMLQMMDDTVDNTGIYSFYRSPSCVISWVHVYYIIYLLDGTQKRALWLDTETVTCFEHNMSLVTQKIAHNKIKVE